MNDKRLRWTLLLTTTIAFAACPAPDVADLETRLNQLEKENAALKTQIETLGAQVKGLVAVTSQNALAIDRPKESPATKVKAKSAPARDALAENIEDTLNRFENCEAPCANAFKNISRKTLRKLAVNPGASASIRACAARCP